MGCDSAISGGVGVGRWSGLGALHRCEPELLEQDVTHLLRGVDVERLTRVRVDARFEHAALVGELVAQLLEEGQVDGDAGRLHTSEHRTSGCSKRW